uniref:Uncharacterized protein n=1 Tax=Ciona intestinalis TaxID=7719 RepID=H2Y3T2_CIOIN
TDCSRTVLLGLRSSFKPDLECTPAELVYGTTLRLPLEFFDERDGCDLPKSEFASRLSSFMETLRFPMRRVQQPVKSHIDHELSSCTHVFIKCGANKGPLHPHYDGPFKVLDKSPKFFTLAMRGRPNTVSIDRIKVAHLPMFPSNLTPISSAYCDENLNESISTEQPLSNTFDSENPYIPAPVEEPLQQEIPNELVRYTRG